MLEADYHDLTLAAYRAGMDGAYWKTFVDMIDEKLDGVWVNIYGYDTKGDAETQVLMTRYSDDDLELYRDYYEGINPFIPVLMRQPLLRMERSEVWIEESELKSSEFYCDFLRPREDIGTGGGGVLFNDGERVLIMAGQVRFKDQEKADQMIDMFRFLAPHVRQAFEMRRVLGGRAILGKESHAAFWETPNALILLDNNGRVCDCNKKAEEMFRARDLLMLDGFGGLRFAETSAQASFDCSLLEIKSTGRPNRAKALIARNANGKLQVVRVTPVDARNEMDAGLVHFTGLRAPIALLSVKPVEISDLDISAILKSTFRLTPSEARLAEGLSKGVALKDFAEANGVSMNTVRTQVKSVFQKTDTHRQGELIALVHSIAN